MQFIVIGRDGDDADAPERRDRVRPKHLEFIRPLVDRGQVLLGGAILDDAGTMVGSTILAEFETRAELDDWLRNDPYVTEGRCRRMDARRSHGREADRRVVTPDRVHVPEASGELLAE
ncbi:MAG: YciI family protein [Actinomycetota bacterium]